MTRDGKISNEHSIMGKEAREASTEPDWLGTGYNSPILISSKLGPWKETLVPGEGNVQGGLF